MLRPYTVPWVSISEMDDHQEGAAQVLPSPYVSLQHKRNMLMDPMTNDHLSLTPVTSFAGAMLEFDLPGLSVGVAEYAEGPTGCTVFVFSKLAQAAVDVR